MAREDEESWAMIVAMQTRSGAAGTRAPADEDPIGEIPQAALLVSKRYPRLPKDQIALIFSNKFRPENLYKLRHMQGRGNRDREKIITFENGTMKIRQSTGTLRDFGPSDAIWSEAFLNYTTVMLSFFGVAYPTLHYGLLQFHAKIRTLSRTYEWQNAVLPMALDFHIEITTGSPTNADDWILTGEYIDLYCTARMVLPYPSATKKRGATGSLKGHVSKKGTSEVCRNFNTKGCTFGKCTREHKCTECDSKEHGAHACTKPEQ